MLLVLNFAPPLNILLPKKFPRTAMSTVDLVKEKSSMPTVLQALSKEAALPKGAAKSETFRRLKGVSVVMISYYLGVLV